MNPIKRATYGVKVVRIAEEPCVTIKLDSPELARQYWDNSIAKMAIFDAQKEHLLVVMLNTRYLTIGWNLVSIGSLNESIAHPRDIYRPAVAMGAYAVILMHNHPSGDPSPSQTDHSLTRRLADVGELLQIKLLDHIIVGEAREKSGTFSANYFSFKEAGIL